MAKTSERKVTEIAKFAESLNFRFIEEGGWCYPSITMESYQGTSAELFGQSMTPEQIGQLGTALVNFSTKLKQDKITENFVRSVIKPECPTHHINYKHCHHGLGEYECDDCNIACYDWSVVCDKHK